jgi:hypothetical protein
MKHAPLSTSADHPTSAKSSPIYAFLICRKGTTFEAMTGRTAPSSDGLLAEVF